MTTDSPELLRDRALIQSDLAALDAAQALPMPVSNPLFVSTARRLAADVGPLLERLDQAEKERDEAGIKWGEHYNTELERLRDHSIKLNSIAWKIADALGDIATGADTHEGDPTEDADRLIAALAAAQARAEAAEAKAALPAPSGRVIGTCMDCCTWNGPRGSAHDPAKCPQRDGTIRAIKERIECDRQRLSNILAAGDAACPQPKSGTVRRKDCPYPICSCLLGAQPQCPTAARPLPEPEQPKRDPECVKNWPECVDGMYDPRCCRFPKSCSCGVLPEPGQP